ncbi:hypothetical protein J2752_002087 [Halarchaeum rubridurum]|uniref:Uncharacterized protein n=1 Tax=Halarchaeum rubridurum TaxID=489911 RepID=A0A830FZW6_9EURY|nr:hypothetical protein [Halarchaeum rubridurum]MBP1955175.1 hypothetical protein [Halarchaeum rubridurum]GGM68339.1 hypothetical protein GCM10009017_18200 [Halarchaeum rubridurum]
MTRSRGLSTVLDVAVCVLLVGGAVVTLAGIAPPTPAADTAPAATARAALDSTATVPVDGAPVRGSVAALFADAAVARGGDTAPPGYVAAVERAAARRLANASGRASLTASWRPDGPCRATTLTAGATPPPGVAVDAVTFVVPTGERPACGDAPVHLTLRTWSR